MKTELQSSSHLHGWKFKILKILNFWNSNLKTCIMSTNITNFQFKWFIEIENNEMQLVKSAWGRLSMENQPQNP